MYLYIYEKKNCEKDHIAMEASKIHCKFSRNICFLQQWISLIFTFGFVIPFIQSLDYSEALSKSLLYFEAQRSDRLPYNQRAIWRHHSGLTDGLDQGVRTFFLAFIIDILMHLRIHPHFYESCLIKVSVKIASAVSLIFLCIFLIDTLDQGRSVKILRP